MTPSQTRTIKWVSGKNGTTLCYLLLLMLSGIVGCQEPTSRPVRIACSANAQFAIQEIAEIFQAETGTSVELITGSSGNLTAQIIQGAPYDVFISADMKYPAEIASRGLNRGPVEPYALGGLVAWTIEQDLVQPAEWITSSDVRRIAIANPELAPYGKAAREYLQNAGYYDAVKDKLIYGESLTQVNQFVMTGAVDLGFTARSVVLSKAFQDRGNWVDVDPSLYSPIEQGCVLLANSVHGSAHDFMVFLRSADARKVLLRHGYQIPNPNAESSE